MAMNTPAPMRRTRSFQRSPGSAARICLGSHPQLGRNASRIICERLLINIFSSSILTQNGPDCSGPWSFCILMRFLKARRHLCLVGQAVSPALLYARIPKKATAFPPERFLCLPHLASVGIPPGQTGSHEATHRGTCFRSAGSRPGSPCLRTTMAARSPHCRHRRRSHSDRGMREALLSALCVGRDAESRAFADSSHGADSSAYEMVERIDGQKREPDTGPNRAAVLARRVMGSLPARFESAQPDCGVYRRKPGFGRTGVFRGALAVVQCRLAGETACPTEPAYPAGRNVETPGPGLLRAGRLTADDG